MRLLLDTHALFLLPNQRGLSRLRKELRESAALEAVRRDYTSQLDPDQLDELKQKLTKQKETVTEVIGSAYPHVARIQGQEVVVSNMTEIGNNLTDHLLAVWRHVTDEEEWVLRKVGAVTLQKSGMVPTEGGIRVRDAVEAFLRYTDKSMVSSTEAVLQGLSQACKDRVIGIGRGMTTEKLQTKRCGEYIALDRSEEGVWIIPPFVKEIPIIVPDPEKKEIGDHQEQKDEHPKKETDKKPLTGEPPSSVQSVNISGTIPMESWVDLFRCFINPASKLGLKTMQLGFNFKLVAQDGQRLDQGNATLKAMREAARQLGILMVEEAGS